MSNSMGAEEQVCNTDSMLYLNGLYQKTSQVAIQMQRNKSNVVEIVDTWSSFNEPWTRHNKG